MGTMAPTLNLPNAIPEPATIALLGLADLSATYSQETLILSKSVS